MASLSLTLRSGVLALGACACGLKLDTGAPGTGSGGMDPMQSTAANRAGTKPATPPEAALNPGLVRNFALEGSAAYSLEDSSFLQCGFQERWSVLFEGNAFERVQEQTLSEECEVSGCLFVITGSGDLSARGRFGQGRLYPREISITKLTSLVRVTRADDLAQLNDISCPN